MNAPEARIIDITDGQAVCRVAGGPACPRCAAGRGCGAGLLSGSQAAREFRVDLPPAADYRVGDRVVLELSSRSLLRASLLAYGMPLVMLAAVPLAAERLWGPLGDATLALLALAAVAASVVAGRRFLRADPCLSQLQPSIAGRAQDTSGRTA